MEIREEIIEKIGWECNPYYSSQTPANFNFPPFYTMIVPHFELTLAKLTNFHDISTTANDNHSN